MNMQFIKKKFRYPLTYEKVLIFIISQRQAQKAIHHCVSDWKVFFQNLKILRVGEDMEKRKANSLLVWVQICTLFLERNLAVFWTVDVHLVWPSNSYLGRDTPLYFYVRRHAQEHPSQHHLEHWKLMNNLNANETQNRCCAVSMKLTKYVYQHG